LQVGKLCVFSAFARAFTALILNLKRPTFSVFPLIVICANHFSLLLSQQTPVIPEALLFLNPEFIVLQECETIRKLCHLLSALF